MKEKGRVSLLMVEWGEDSCRNGREVFSGERAHPRLQLLSEFSH